jgi:hypothetical protein
LLTAEAEKLNSMNLLMFMAPISVVALVPATMVLEPGAMDKAVQLASENFGFVLLLLLNSLTAYFVNLTNFLVTKHTSALTLQVCRRSSHMHHRAFYSTSTCKQPTRTETAGRSSALLQLPIAVSFTC